SLASADAAEQAEPLLAAENPALDEEPLFTVGIDDHARRTIAKRRIHVLVPQLDRLEDVTVCVDDVVGTRHGGPPVGRCADPTTASRWSSRPARRPDRAPHAFRRRRHLHVLDTEF